MLTFPVAGGTSVHILGGTILAIILGPYAGMLSMTLVLGMQAFFFADGGLLAFGANALNMAIVGGLSFFLIKLFAGKSASRKQFAVAVFIATLTSAIATALLTGVEIGLSQAFAASGGMALTVPTMLTVYAIEGVVEATVTSFLATGLMLLPASYQRAALGIRLLQGKQSI
jgi:cobalt/nickel transport system permease protein